MKHSLWSLAISLALVGAGCGSDSSSPDAATQQPADAARVIDAARAIDAARTIDAAPSGQADAAGGNQNDAGDDLSAD